MFTDVNLQMYIKQLTISELPKMVSERGLQM